MPDYYNDTYRMHQLRPSHHSDNKTWKTWPQEPGLVVERGSALLKWTVKKVPSSQIPNGNRHYTNTYQVFERTKLFSFDGGVSWQEDTFTKSYKWGADPSAGTGRRLEEAILEAKKDEQRRRSRERARERNAELKKQAEKEGITLTELKNRLKEERLRANPHKVSKKTIEQTKRKMEMGPYLKDLKDEVDYVMEHFNSDDVEIKHVKRAIKRIREATNFIRGWHK